MYNCKICYKSKQGYPEDAENKYSTPENNPTSHKIYIYAKAQEVFYKYLCIF